MLIKSFVLLGVLFAVARSARIPRNIPVEVRYDEITGKELKQQEGLPHQEADLQEIGCSREEILQRLKQEQAPAQAVVATVTEDLGNVRDSLAQESSKEEIASVQPEKTTNLPEQNAEILPASNPTKNLEEKPQLSSQQQKEALKHLPEPEKQENAIILKKLGGSSPGKQLEDLQTVIRQAQDIVSNGIKRIKDFQPEKGQISLNPQQWQDLEKALDEYFDEEKAKLTLKQTSTNTTNQNFFANLASGFQTIATNFVQSIQGSNNASGPADEAGGSGSSPGGWQGFVSFFQGGIQTISNSINNLGGQGSSTSNTVLGDSASTTESQGIFSSFVNNISQGVQTFIGQIQQNGAAAPGGTQGDPGSNATTANQGPIQTGIQQIGSAINNFIQNNRPTGSPGDEGTAGNNTNIIQSIGNAIQQFNPFRPGEQGSQGGLPAIQGQNPAEGIQSGIQNVGNQIQQLVPGQQSSTEGSKKPEDAPSPTVVAQEPQQQQQEEQQSQKEPEVQQNEATEPKPAARGGLSPQGVDGAKREILVTVE